MIPVGLLKGHFTMEWLFCWLWWGRNIFEKLDYQSGRPDLNRRPLDPQEVGLAVLTGQRGSDSPALGAPTCRLFGHMHSVWSQSGPKFVKLHQLGCDSLFRRCRTVVRCSGLPAQIAPARLIEGHGVQTWWCRLWVSRSGPGSSNLPAPSLFWNSPWTCITASPARRSPRDRFLIAEVEGQAVYMPGRKG